MKFLVMRPHQGDKWYRDGDIREARESEVAHLVRGGVLRKMDEPPANKARYVLEDKAAPLADGRLVRRNLRSHRQRPECESRAARKNPGPLQSPDG